MSIDDNDSPVKAKGAFDRARDDFQKQIIADPAIPANFLKVAIAISLNFSRKQFMRGNGLVAWPGIERTLAPLTGLSPRTVMRAVQWLEKRGHVQVTRKKNRANNYFPLRKAISQLNEVPKARVSPVGDSTLSPDSLSLPLTLYKNRAALGSAAINNRDSGREESKQEDFRESREPVESPLSSIEAECYRLAREYQPNGGPALVTRALRIISPEECMDRLYDAIEMGGALGEFLFIKGLE
jgi:hypothetical protein